MHILIDKKLFSNAVHIASRFAERRAATLPALSTILILAGDDGIKMRATNLETGVDISLEGECKRRGAVAVPAVILAPISSSLSFEGPVVLEQTGDLLLLKNGTGKSSLKTIPYDDFPSIPLPNNPQSTFTLPGATFSKLLNTLASCASPSVIRPELASIYFSLEGNALTAAATDSFRLAEKKISLTNKGIKGSLLIPAKNALEIAQALPQNEDIAFSFDDHQCAFTWEKGTLVSRLTNAVYPDYRQIIPKKSVAEATVLRRDFETALKRTSIFSDAFHKIRIGFHQKKKRFSLFAHNPDIGESIEELPGRLSGSDLELSFNHRYLAAALSLTETESLSFSAAGIGQPLVIKGVGDASLTYLLSPMNQ